MSQNKAPIAVTEERLPLLEEILGQWKKEIADDFLSYYNHVYRVVHFCFALHDCNHEEREKIMIAGCFHDLGIWANHTFDYLSPSITLAQEYLIRNHLESWIPEIALIIDTHHKVRRHRDEHSPLVEVFRKGDWVDVSWGLMRYGLTKAFVQCIQDRFPNAGFHKRLVQLASGWFLKHPFKPVPVLKW